MVLQKNDNQNMNLQTMIRQHWKVYFFLMDKFGVGDEFVHELSMVVNDFPVKSYLIKQCRSMLNKEVRITTTPGLAPGAQYSFNTLLAEKIKTMVCYPFTPALLICHFTTLCH